jgi:NTE family protein
MATNDRIEDFLHKFTTAKFFHEMKVPLSIVATDLLSGTSIHFTQGEIGPALRASCAYPGLFLPVEHQSRILVDGFLTETVPAEAARDMGADIVIGVHLEPGLLRSAPRNTIEVISRSFSILQTSATQLWHSDVDVLLEPDVHHVQWDEFVKTPQLVAAGEAATREAVPQIKDLIALSASQRLNNRKGLDRRRNRPARSKSLETRP